MLTSITKRLVVGMVTLVSFAFSAKAQMPQVQPLPIDPAVKMGKLDNGLTYLIRKNKNPEGRAHFFIAQKVGSMQEEENQRGLAHFLEHIAFNGTKNFPGKNMINWLESIGVKFGANLNAYTSFDETVYELMDVPTTRQSTVDSCLLILHDWSNSISLEDKEIDNERGVIEEEWRQRESGNLRVMTQMLANAFPNNKYGQRMPIGLMSIVRNFKYEELRAYYRKWYRPDLQGLIIVGDIDPDQVEATIKRQFADVPKPVNPAERVYQQVEDFKGVRASVATDKEAVGTNIGIDFITDPAPAEVRASQYGFMMNYMRSIIGAVLAERFNDITKKPNAPFLSAGGSIGDFVIAMTKDSFSFSAVASDGKADVAIKALVAEIERLRQYGITKAELERAKKNYLTGVKKLYDEREKHKNSAYATEYAAYFTRGGYIPGIEVEYQLANAIAEQLPAEAFNQVLQQTLSVEDNIFVSLTGPDKDGIKYPTESELITLFKEARKQKVEPLKEEVSNTKLIEQAPKAGKIVKEDKNGKFGSKVWTLSNGIQVVVKSTTHKEDEIRFSAQRRGGLLAFAKKDELEARAFNSIINLGGLGKFDDSALDKALSGRIASASPTFGNTSDNISGSSTKADLETMMQLIYLNFTQKRSDKEAFDAYVEKAIAQLKMAEANPMASLGDSITMAISPNQPHLLSLKEADYKRINYSRAMQMYQERMGNAGGFKFVFVGNIDEAVFRPLVEKYIASLPVNKKATITPDVSRFPKLRQGVYTNHYTKQMENPMGFVFNLYSGKLDFNQRNKLTMHILSEILDQVYVETIREREGGTYGASSNADIDREPKGEAQLTVFYQTDPTKAERLNQIVNEELARIVKDGTVNQEQFDKTVNNLQKNYEENQKENGYWLGNLMRYYQYNEDGVSDYISLLKSIKPTDVATLLKQLLAQKNTVEVMMLPEAKK